MKKMIVYESLRDFQEAQSLNEGAISTVKNWLKKTGKFFVDFFNGLISPVISPVNIGIMDKGGYLSDAITYIPSSGDISMEPGLKSLTEEAIYEKRGGRDDSPHKLEESLNEGSPVPLNHPNDKIRNVNKDELFAEIRMAIKNPTGTPLIIWGAPGIGKTQIVSAVLKSRGNGRLIDVQTAKMAPDDWALPVIVRQELDAKGVKALGDPASFKIKDTGYNVKAIDLPKSWLPVYVPTGDPEEDKRLDDLANLGEGGILFLDELSRARASVQNTCLKLIDQRIIGDSVLGSKWTIISAANRFIDDMAGDQVWSTALGNRFAQINYVPTFEGWKEWASGKVDPRILDFLEFNKQYFYTLEQGEGSEEAQIFASPRTWAKASEAIANLSKDAEEEGYRVTSKLIQNAVHNLVGGDIAIAFGVFLRLSETFTKEDIKMVLTKPDKAPLPKKKGSSFDPAEASALLAIICSSTRGRDLTSKEFENFIEYIIRLDNSTQATAAFKIMFRIHDGSDGLIDMNAEMGEADGRDLYLKGYEMFAEKYGKFF